MKVYTHAITTPIGSVRLYANKQALIGLLLPKERIGPLHSQIQQPISEKTSILEWAEQELTLYFSGTLKRFTIPVQLIGTDFQISIWKELCQVHTGDLSTYAEIAKKISRAKAVRATGTAIGKNPIALIVPCHRIIGKNGTLTGYAGGLDTKAWLLRHEGHRIVGDGRLAKVSNLK